MEEKIYKKMHRIRDYDIWKMVLKTFESRERKTLGEFILEGINIYREIDEIPIDLYYKFEDIDRTNRITALFEILFEMRYNPRPKLNLEPDWYTDPDHFKLDLPRELRRHVFKHLILEYLDSGDSDMLLRLQPQNEKTAKWYINIIQNEYRDKFKKVIMGHLYKEEYHMVFLLRPQNDNISWYDDMLRTDNDFQCYMIQNLNVITDAYQHGYTVSSELKYHLMDRDSLLDCLNNYLFQFNDIDFLKLFLQDDKFDRMEKIESLAEIVGHSKFNLLKSDIKEIIKSFLS